MFSLVYLTWEGYGLLLPVFLLAMFVFRWDDWHWMKSPTLWTVALLATAVVVLELMLAGDFPSRPTCDWPGIAPLADSYSRLLLPETDFLGLLANLSGGKPRHPDYPSLAWPPVNQAGSPSGLFVFGDCPFLSISHLFFGELLTSLFLRMFPV